MSLIKDKRRNKGPDFEFRQSFVTKEHFYYSCSECKKWLYFGVLKNLLKKYKYCHYCGSKLID
jgi:DNA-directed RNA polymerase subunit RPC12/RpoP